MQTPRKTPRQQRSRHTVEAILGAAAQLFQRDGYAATTTNHIASRAGVSIGSVYQYFPNKDALLGALAEQHVDDAIRTLQPVFAHVRKSGMTLEATLRTLVASVAALHFDQPQLHRLLFDQAPRTPQLVSRFREMEQGAARALAGELRRLGVGAPDPDLNALLAVQGIEAQLHGAMLDPLPGRTPAGTTEAVITLWVHALSTPLR